MRNAPEQAVPEQKAVLQEAGAGRLPEAAVPGRALPRGIQGHAAVIRLLIIGEVLLRAEEGEATDGEITGAAIL